MTEKRTAEPDGRRAQEQRERDTAGAGAFEWLFDQALDPILLIQPSRGILRANAAATRALGFSEEELRALTARSLAVENDGLRALLKAREDTGSAQGQITLRRANGSTFEAEVSTALLPGSPQPLAYLMFRDISAREAAVRELRASKYRLRLMIEHAPATIAMLDREMRYLAHSRRFLTDFKLPPESLVGRSHYEVFPDLPERWKEVHRRCLAGASERSDEESFEGPDGAPEWIRWEVVPWHDDQGEVGGIVIFSEHITQLKRAQERLANHERLLSDVIDGTPSLIFAFDKEGRIQLVNDAAVRFSNTTREALLGTFPGQNFAPEVARSYQERHREVMATGQVQTLELNVPLPEGERTVLASRYPLRDVAGNVYGTASITTDVTHQKQIEADLRRSEARAREAVEALENALEVTRRTEEKLRQVQKMEAVGRLAGGIAHDFNNILTVILATAEGLAEELSPADPLREGIVEIEKAGQRAADLTRQLLAFSRKQVLEPRICDVNELLKSIEKMLYRLIREDIELTLLLHPHPCLCKIDRGQFDQVLINLVVNARDAMPEGGRLIIETTLVTLDASYNEEHPDTTPGEYVRVTVTDNGTGMSKDVRSHVFDPFFTTKSVGLGTGLGLSTVYGIVRQSGGHIWVYSEPGQGTSFKLYFPREQGSPTEGPRATPSLVAAGGKETILLVEDDNQVRSTIALVLRRAGYHVIQASNGGEALLLCEQHGGTIQLLLTDVVMPKMNGRKVAERLQQVRPKMRVVFMSGYTEDAIVHHGVLDSGIDFVPKPISTEALLAKLREVLDR